MANGNIIEPGMPWIPADNSELQRRRLEYEAKDIAWFNGFRLSKNVTYIFDNDDNGYDVNGDLDVSNISFIRIRINKVNGNYICGEKNFFPTPQYGPKGITGDFTYDLTCSRFPHLNELERNRIQDDIRTRIKGIREFCLIRGRIYLSAGGLGFKGTPNL